MSGAKFLGIGASGAIITGLCCLTPLLPITLGALGLSAWLAWSDYVAMPALLIFTAMAIYGLASRRRTAGASCRDANVTIAGKKDGSDGHA